MLITTPLRAAALLAVGLTLGGCSGGSGDADAAATASSASASASATADATSTAPATSPTSAAGATQDDAAAKFCSDREELTALGSQMQQAGKQSLFDQLPTYVQKLDAMQPPEVVAADFATYVKGWHAIADATAGETVESPDLEAKVTAAIAANPGVQTAETNLKAWTDANCAAASATPSAS